MYKCTQKKQEIVDILAEEFKKVSNELDSNSTPENFARYQMMMDLLQKIKIYEED